MKILLSFALIFAGCVYRYTEKEFTFLSMNRKEIKVEITRSNSDADVSRMASFFPKLENTHENLRLISMELLSEIYGKQRGAFELRNIKKASSTKDLVTTCWQISDSSQNFCVLPTGEKDGEIFILSFWLE